MKSRAYLLGLALVGLCVLGPPAAGADEGVKVSLGVKSWYNSWEEKFGGRPDVTTSWAMMVGPSLTLRYRKVFVGGAYLVSASEYETDQAGFEKERLDRADIDVTAGYLFTPSFGAFVGYKSIDISSTAEATPFEASVTLAGPGIGIVGNVPLGESVALYGNLAVLSVNRSYTDNSPTTPDADYTMLGGSAEVGVAVAFNAVVSATLGAKAQVFTGEDDHAGADRTTTFSGLTLGVSATF